MERLSRRSCCAAIGGFDRGIKVAAARYLSLVVGLGIYSGLGGGLSLRRFFFKFSTAASANRSDHSSFVSGAASFVDGFGDPTGFVFFVDRIS